MSRYGLGKGAVLGVLASRGATMRRQGLSPDEQDAAAQAYACGASAAAVAAQFSCSSDSVLTYARAHGVAIRKPWQRSNG